MLTQGSGYKTGSPCKGCNRLAYVKVISEDTDVIVMLLAFNTQIGGHLLRVIDIFRLATILVRNSCTALSGVQVWTGFDSVSAFSGQENIKAVNLIQ
jgi:hypothetical protein